MALAEVALRSGDEQPPSLTLLLPTGMQMSEEGKGCGDLMWSYPAQNEPHFNCRARLASSRMSVDGRSTDGMGMENATRGAPAGPLSGLLVSHGAHGPVGTVADHVGWPRARWPGRVWAEHAILHVWAPFLG